MRSREEALEATLKQIDRMEWEPAKAEEPDIGTELVLYLMEKNAVMKEALETVREWFMGYTANFGTDVAEEIAVIDAALAIATTTASTPPDNSLELRAPRASDTP